MADNNLENCDGIDSEEGLGVWNIRYAGINSLIGDSIVEAGLSKHPYSKQIHDLLKRLQIFGGQQFSFFRNGFDGNRFDPLSAAVSQEYLQYAGVAYPIADFALWLTSNQVSNDTLTLREVLRQTRKPLEDGADPLNRADRIAFSVLNSLGSVFPVRYPYQEQLQFISYYRRGTSVRVLPYAPVALIGIPLSSKWASRDLISIAHEVAHFYYWYGRMKGTNEAISTVLEQSLEDLLVIFGGATGETPPPIQHWLEEIFADMVSVLIAGPVAGYSMQELSIISVGIHFEKDSGTHPMSSFRPFVHAQVLKKIGAELELTELQKAGNLLERRWQCIRADRFSPTEINIEQPPHDEVSNRFYRSSSSVEYNIQIVRDLVDLLIHEIWQLIEAQEPGWIQGQFRSGVHGDPKAWTQDVDFVDPYAEFNVWLGEFEGEEPKVFTAEKFPPDLWETLMDDLFQSRNIQNPNENRVYEHGDLTQGSLPPEVWIDILRFAGWTTEGPTGRGH